MRQIDPAAAHPSQVGGALTVPDSKGRNEHKRKTAQHHRSHPVVDSMCA